MKLYKLLLLLALITTLKSFASGGCSGTELPCSSASPFCSSVAYNFPNETSTCAPSGPDYGCVTTTDNPVWYYMQINQSGPLIMNLSQSTGPNGTGSGLDVDFVMWGPFSSLSSGCSAVNGGISPIQSGYSSSSTETLALGATGGSYLSSTSCTGVTTPPSAVSGQFYIVMITNYDGSSGYISFNQTNTSSSGAGSADCAIVTPCDITSITATPGSCNASGQYSVSGSISFTSAPSTGTLTITNSAGGTQTVSAPFTSPYNYSYTGLTGTGGTATITATFSDDATCTRSTTYTVPTCGCSVTATNNGPVCESATFGLGASNVSGATSYTWSGPGGFSSTTQSPNGLTAPATNGTYTYTVSVNSSSGTCSASTTLTVNDVTAVPTVSVAAPTCSGNGTASVSNYAGGLTYTFSPSGPTVGVTGVISSMSAGTNYTLTASSGSCTSTASTPFSIAAQLITPATPLITTNPPTCAAPGNAALTNYDGAVSYTFSPAGPSINAADGVISGMITGTSYTLSATNGSCTATSAPFSISDQLTTPPTPIISSTAETCTADGAASVSNYSGTYTYAFSPAGPSVDGAGMISGMSFGTSYMVTATDGVCTSTASSPFNINQQLAVPVLTLVGQSVCSPNTVDITSPSVSSTDIGTLSYYTDAALSVAVATPTAVGSGTYYVEAVSGACSTSGSLAITVTTTPTLTLNDQSICSPNTIDLTDPSIATSDVGTMSYYTDVALTMPVSNPSAVGAGTYYLEATNGSCSFSGSIDVVVTTTPTLTLVSQNICSPNTTDLTSPTVSSTDVGTLAYYSDATLTTVLSNPSAVGNGIYYVEATNGTCASNGSITVTVTTTPTLTLNDQSVCSPNTVDLTDPSIATTDVGTLAYYSDLALTVPVSNPSAVGAGTYYLEATNGSCSFSGVLDVLVTTTPTLTLVSQSTCTPYTVDLTSPSVVSVDLGTLTYYSDAALASVVADPTAVGTGVYYVEAVNGICSSNGSLTVTITTTPTLTLVDQTVCSPATVDLTDPAVSSTDVGSLAYYSDLSLTTPIVDPTSVGTGTYYVEATNGSCTFSGVLDVTVKDLPVISANAPAVSCGSYTLPAITGAFIVNESYWTGTNQTGTQYQAGDVLTSSITLYMYAGSTGCSDEESFLITVNPLPTVTSLNNGAVYCQGDNIVPIEAVVTGSADWVIDYTLDGLPLSVTASSSPVSLGNNSGVYVLMSISDANCSNVADGSQIIEINPCEIVIPSAFTPNGDMMNDFWEIIYLDDVYPESQISVYNRWGEKVYESEKGQYATKPWDGTFNGTLLPVASYFYILDPGDGSDKRNGTVSIILKK